MTWLKFSDVSVNSGSKLVSINDASPTSAIEPGYALVLSGNIFEIAGKTLNTITLVDSFSLPSVENVTADVMQTYGPIADLITEAIEVLQSNAQIITLEQVNSIVDSKIAAASLGGGNSGGDPTPDTTNPVVTTPVNSSMQFANGGAGIAHNNSALLSWLAQAAATDNVDANLTVNNNLSSLVNPLAAAVHTITFSATDSAGNTGTNNATLTITEADPVVVDTTDPVVTAPSNTALTYINGGSGLAHNNAALVAWLNSASALDNVDGMVAVSNNLSALSNPITDGTHTITFSATDAAGNTGTNTATLTISEAAYVDTAAPVVTVPGNTSLQFIFGGGGLAHNDADLLAWLATASATDNLDSNVTVTNNLSALNNPIVSGAHTITFSATDAAGNTGTNTATLTVSQAAYVDTADPVVAPPSNASIEFIYGAGGLAHNDANLLAWLNSASATDNFDASVSVTNNLASFNDPIASGVHNFTFSSTDAAGNTGTNTATLTISEAAYVDTVDPVVTPPNNTSIDYGTDASGLAHNDADLLAWLDTASAADNWDASVSVTHNLSALNNPIPAGVHTITFSATDAAGNTGTSTALLTVDQSIQPVAQNLVVNMNQGDSKNISLGDASNTDGAITYSITPPDFTITGNMVAITANTGGSHTYTITANDGNGPDITYPLTLNVIATQAEPSLIDFIGWSLLFNENNGDASLAHGANYASVPQLLETMFKADSINHTLNQSIWGPTAFMDSLADQSVIDFVNASTAQGIVVSGHSSSSGLDPAGPPTWYDETATLANAVNAAGKNLIWYQGWLHNDNAAWDNTNVVDNFNYLKATHGGVLVKTYECLDHFRINYPGYFNTVEQGYGIYPVTELFADSVHGTFALYYMATACLYRALTGKLTGSMLYEAPGLYQLDADLLAKINDTVDLIQDDTYPGITLEAYGTGYQEIWIAAGTAQGTLPPNGEKISYLDMSNTTTTILIDYKGSNTGITVTIPGTIYGGSTAVAAAVGENTGYLADVLLDYVEFHDASAIVLTFDGLTPDAEYNFKATGSRTGSGTRTQDWTIGGVVNSFDATENRDSGVSATFTADATGQAIITLDKNATTGNGWVYFSGAILSKGIKPVIYDDVITSNQIEVI